MVQQADWSADEETFRSMALLIDGYNLLHASGIIPSGIGSGTLRRARQALLNYLVLVLGPGEIAKTTVVFDAQCAPPGLPREVNHRGIQVLFADKHEEADDLLEELIQADSSPKQLTVVSSDHRIQRAARRRRAVPIDSDQWCGELARRNRELAKSMEVELAENKPRLPLSRSEVEDWLSVFAGADFMEEDPRFETLDPTEADLLDPLNQCGAYLEDDPDEAPGQADSVDQEVDDEDMTDLGDGEIFPPGYGEDLLE